MKNNLFIPKKIRIGFQERSDTYTGKLGYIIYYDAQDKIRQETSWENWRSDKIEPIEINNTPQSGFVLNKGVQRDGHFSSGRSIVRVYDNRDFEFEISIDNLIRLLTHSDVSKREIVEECIFAWSGQNLILLPINSKEYKDSVEFTKKQDTIISKEIIRQNSEKESRGGWKTNCNLWHNGRSINIQTASVDTIVTVYAFLLNELSSLNNARVKLGLPESNDLDGYDIKEWEYDFKKRINKISLNKQKEELTTLSNRLNCITSEDQKRQSELESITQFIKEL